MVTGVNSMLASSLPGSAGGAGKTVSPADSFSQQLLAVLQRSLEQLGVAPAGVQLVQHGGGNPSQRQFVVTVAGNPGPPETPDTPLLEAMYENHPGFNPRLYASEEMAGWLARRLGGEVSTFQWQWSPEVPQPPAGYSIRFGGKEINAGALAMYFEPGRFAGADQEAALALFRDGVVNDYVRQHRPELIEEFGMPA